MKHAQYVGDIYFPSTLSLSSSTSNIYLSPISSPLFVNITEIGKQLLIARSKGAHIPPPSGMYDYTCYSFIFLTIPWYKLYIDVWSFFQYRVCKTFLDVTSPISIIGNAFLVNSSKTIQIFVSHDKHIQKLQIDNSVDSIAWYIFIFM